MHKTDQQEKKQKKPVAAVEKPVLSFRVVNVSVILIGAFLSLSSFYLLNLFIERVLSEEYDRLSYRIVEIVNNKFQGIEWDLDQNIRIINLTKNIPANFTNYNRQQLTNNIQHFDHVIWLFRTESGAWSFKDLHQKEERLSTGRVLSFRVDQKLIGALPFDKIVQSQSLTILEKLPSLPDFSFEEASKVSPFAVAKAVDAGNPKAGIIIALINPVQFMKGEIRAFWDLIFGLSITHIETGSTILSLDREDLKESEDASANTYIFDLSFADNDFEIVLMVGRQENTVSILSYIPEFVLFFSIVLTLIIALYVKENASQSRQMEELNDILANKNLDMEKEVRERERLNQALRKAERENRAVIDAVSDVIFELDVMGKTLFLNAAWEKVTGLKVEDFIDEDFFSMLHPDDQVEQRLNFEKLTEGGKAAYRAFTRVISANDEYRGVELSISMIRQDENKNIRVVGTLTDIEERQRVERALAEAEKKYRTIVENAAGGIYQQGLDGKYISVNPAFARILGYRDEEDFLKDHNERSVQIYESQNERKALLNEVKSKHAVHNREIKVLSRNGDTVWVNENIRAVLDGSGQVSYFEGSIENITKRIEYEKGLQEAKVSSDLANRAKSEFLANMSHELRTPLNSIIGFSEIIKDEVFGPLEQKAYWEYARDIHDSGQRLLQVINEILEISKIETGDRDLKEAEINTAEVISSVLDLMAVKIEANQMKVTNNLQNIPYILGEKLAVKQMAINIISNAIKFTPSEGMITISYQIDGDKNLRLSFTDTGIGLNENDIEKALSPFGQIDNALDREGSGTGLGLTLVKALAELHDGKVEIFSQKGIGTTVTIVFPKNRVITNPKTKKDKKDQTQEPDQKEETAEIKTDDSSGPDQDLSIREDS